MGFVWQRKIYDHVY